VPIGVGAASASVATLAGLPVGVALAMGVVVGLAAWRPRLAPGSLLPPAPVTPTPQASGPGLELGPIMAVPPQAALLVPGQPFWLALDELERHALVIGATGVGKTTTLGRLMDAALGAGWSVVVVDAKGGQLVQVCRRVGLRHGRPARIWLPGHFDSWTYDPCAGEPTAVGNRLVGAFEHGLNGQVYRNLSQAVVPLAVRSLLESGQPCTLDTLRASLDRAHLTGLARRTPDPLLKAELIAMLEDDLHRKTLAGLAGRLRSLRHGLFGAALLPSDRTLDLAAALAEPGISYLGLPATAASEDVALVGRVLIQHLKQLAYAALWSDPSQRALLVFDEFASLGDAPQLIDLLLQAREARLAVVVSTQHLPRDYALRSSLVGCGVLVVHQIGWPAEARDLAEMLGMRSGMAIQRQVRLGPAGTLTRRLWRGRQALLIGPDELARLPTGQAAIAVRFAAQRLAIVQVKPLRLE